jgi:hypothetical protein
MLITSLSKKKTAWLRHSLWHTSPLETNAPPICYIKNFWPQLTRLSGRHFDLHQEKCTHTISIDSIKQFNRATRRARKGKGEYILGWKRSGDRPI